MPKETDSAKGIHDRKRKTLRDFSFDADRNTNESSGFERDDRQTTVLPVACPQQDQCTRCSSRYMTKHRKLDPGNDGERKASTSEQIPARVSQQWDPVIRFFVPPKLFWIYAKRHELGISEVIERPPYGRAKSFDGLSSRPLAFLYIIGDGHCGFRCISVMLTGSQDSFRILRRRVAEFVVEHASEGWLSPHLPSPFHASSYLNRMLCTHGFVGRENYCTDVELMAAAVLFRMNILCYKADRGKWQLYAHNMSFEQTNDIPTLLIELRCGHFTVVTDVEPYPPESEQHDNEQDTLNSGIEMVQKKIQARNTLRVNKEPPSTELPERRVDTDFKESSESDGCNSETAENKLGPCQTLAVTPMPQMPCSPTTVSSKPMEPNGEQNTLNSGLKLPRGDTKACDGVGVKKELPHPELPKSNAATGPNEDAESCGVNSEKEAHHLGDSGPSPPMVKPHEPSSLIKESRGPMRRKEEQNTENRCMKAQREDAKAIEEELADIEVPKSKGAIRLIKEMESRGDNIEGASRHLGESRASPAILEPTKHCRKTSSGGSDATRSDEDRKSLTKNPTLVNSCEEWRALGDPESMIHKAEQAIVHRPGEAKADSSEHIPERVSQRWDPVIRFFLPPKLSWIYAKCDELGIYEVTERPPYGRAKSFDGLSSRPLTFLYIIGDGHCGFRSLSVMLTGSQDYFGIIRKRVAEFVVEHASEGWLSPHLPSPFHASSYLNRMLCTRRFVGRENYCTDVELMAAAVLFRMNILCYKADRGKWQLYAHNMSFDQTNDVPTLLIELRCAHFTVVTDVEPYPPNMLGDSVDEFRKSEDYKGNEGYSSASSESSDEIASCLFSHGKTKREEPSAMQKPVAGTADDGSISSSTDDTKRKRDTSLSSSFRDRRASSTNYQVLQKEAELEQEVFQSEVFDNSGYFLLQKQGPGELPSSQKNDCAVPRSEPGSDNSPTAADVHF